MKCQLLTLPPSFIISRRRQKTLVPHCDDLSSCVTHVHLPFSPSPNPPPWALRATRRTFGSITSSKRMEKALMMAVFQIREVGATLLSTRTGTFLSSNPQTDRSSGQTPLSRQMTSGSLQIRTQQCPMDTTLSTMSLFLESSKGRRPSI